MSEHTRKLRPKHDGAEVTPSICPYCGVGCGQLVYHKNGKLISIEGDPNSPISRGHLCPKGADTYELQAPIVVVTHAAPPIPPKRNERLFFTFVTDGVQAAVARAVEAAGERAVTVVGGADLTRQETRDGESLMQTTAIAHLGGATLDNEENYLIKKLFTGGLGMVCISNQARI